MKKIFLFLLLLVPYLSFSQGLPAKTGITSEKQGTPIDLSNNELKTDIQDVANSVASKIASSQCCSSYGAKGVRADVDWEKCYYNAIRNTYFVVTTFRWTGAWSGSAYWVKGKLKLKYSTLADGSVTEEREFEKIDMSPGLSPGCVESCYINSKL